MWMKCLDMQQFHSGKNPLNPAYTALQIPQPTDFNEMCPRRQMPRVQDDANKLYTTIYQEGGPSLHTRVTIILWVTKMTVRMMSDLVKSSHLVWFRLSIFSDKQAGTSKELEGPWSTASKWDCMKWDRISTHSRGQEVVMVADGDGRSSTSLLMNRRRTSIPTREKIYEILRITPIQLNSYHPVHSNPY